MLGDNNKVLLLGPDGFNDSATVTDAGAAAEGMYVTIGGPDPNALTNAAGKAFIAAYKKTYKVDHLEAYTAYGAQAFLVLANAITQERRLARARSRRTSTTRASRRASSGRSRSTTRAIRRSAASPSTSTSAARSKIITVDHPAGRPGRSRHSANHTQLAEERTTGGARGWRPTARARRPILALAPRLRGPGERRDRGHLPAGARRDLAGRELRRATPQQFVLVFLAGITNGSIYALVALGYTLVYGILELINFAHGDVFTWGAMVTYTVAVSWIGLDGSQSGFVLFGALLLALICSAIFCATLNVAIERVAYRRLRNAPRLAPLITAIGMSFVLSNLIGVIYGFGYKSSNALLPTGAVFYIGNQPYGWDKLIVLLITIPVLLALVWLVKLHALGQGDARDCAGS